MEHAYQSQLRQTIFQILVISTNLGITYAEANQQLLGSPNTAAAMGSMGNPQMATAAQVETLSKSAANTFNAVGYDPSKAKNIINQDPKLSDQDKKIMGEEIDKLAARSKLDDYQASGSSAVNGGRNSESSNGGSGGLPLGGHASSLGSFGSYSPSTASTFEGYDPWARNYSQLDASVSSFRSSFNSYTNSLSSLSLPSGLRTDAVNSYVNWARDMIDMPRGKEKSPEENALFAALNQGAQAELKGSFLGLTKNSALEKDPKEDIAYLKDLIKNNDFQATAVKILGKDNLNYLNYSTIGADLMSSKLAPGAAYAALMDLTDGVSNGAGPNEFTSEWLEAARFISSDVFTKRMNDQTKSQAFKRGYVELSNVVKKLTAYKSLDMLNELAIPSQVDFDKMSDAAVITAVSCLRKSSRIMAKTGWDEGILSDFNYFIEKIKGHLKEVSTITEKKELLSVFEKIMANNSLRAYWRSFDLPTYFKFRRSVGVFYATQVFDAFNKLNLKTFPDISKIKENDIPKSDLVVLVFHAMKRVQEEKSRALARARSEEDDDKQYSINKLSKDIYYPALEEEKD